MLRAAGKSDKGRIRPTNEDCFAVEEPLGLCVVADGMGGHNAGEVAARMAVDAVVDYVRSRSAKVSRSIARSRSAEGSRSIATEREALAERHDDWPFGFDDALSVEANVLRSAIHVANIQILEASIGADTYAGMGTTIVAARVVGDRLIVAHVGDSRLYRLDRTTFTQMTSDDSWVATVLAQDPAVDRAVLMHHPMRNALTNVVGAKGRTEVHVVEHAIEDGDVLLLSTDGVHGVLDDRNLERLLRTDGELGAIADRLIEAALQRGSRDNCTAIVARYMAHG